MLTHAYGMRQASILWVCCQVVFEECDHIPSDAFFGISYACMPDPWLLPNQQGTAVTQQGQTPLMLGQLPGGTTLTRLAYLSINAPECCDLDFCCENVLLWKSQSNLCSSQSQRSGSEASKAMFEIFLSGWSCTVSVFSAEPHTRLPPLRCINRCLRPPYYESLYMYNCFCFNSQHKVSASKRHHHASPRWTLRTENRISWAECQCTSQQRMLSSVRYGTRLNSLFKEKHLMGYAWCILQSGSLR